MIVLGLTWGWNANAVHENFGNFWGPRDVSPVTSGLSALTAFGLIVAICISQSGSLFSADSWHNITFTGGEVRDPRRTLAIALGVGSALVILLYLLANVAYLVVLPFSQIQHAPADRVATAMMDAMFPAWGSNIMAVAIMISTFGCVNSLVLAGPRVYYAMGLDGLFFKKAATLNRAKVPAWSLTLQCIWSAALVLPRTFNGETGKYGNLYSDLLDYVISAALIFYILTIAAVFRLRSTRPNAERRYRAFGYPVIPALYIVGAAAVLLSLFVYRASTTWPGLLIVLCGLPIYWAMKLPARMAGKLDEQTAIVTGSSRGIGKAIAIRFAREGAAVVVHGTDRERCSSTVAEIEDAGGCASAFPGDITTPGFAEDLARFAVERFGSLDYFVANAGILGFASFLEMTADTFQRFQNVHVTGAFTTSQAAAKQMVRAGKGGRILYMSSVSAVNAMYGYAAYCSAKSAIMALTRVAAVELAEHRICVNALAPGPVETEALDDLWGPERLKERSRAIPAGRIAKPDDVAEVAVFLCSQAAAYITGQTIFIDGGATAAGLYSNEVFKRSGK